MASQSYVSTLPPETLLIKIDSPYTQGVNLCSPKIAEFLKGLHSSNSHLDFAFLKSAGVSFDTYGVFRCSESIRSYSDQALLYEKSHSGSFTKETVLGSRPLQGVRYIWNGSSALKSGGVTNALPGASFHQWGLAVDIYFRKFGWEAWSNGKTVTVDGVSYTMPAFYKKSGLVSWAESCGLEWGGSWSDFQDTVHFQDSQSLPDKRLWLSLNNDYQSFVSCKAYSFSESVSSSDSVPSAASSDSLSFSFSDFFFRILDSLFFRVSGFILLCFYLLRWFFKR